MTCTNCGGPLPANHGTTSKDGKYKFCDACTGYADALAIGARSPAVLYESDGGYATSGTGARMGYIVHKTKPSRRFSPVRFRVMMLDGSMWYGTGPTANGNYLRLRPLKGG